MVRIFVEGTEHEVKEGLNLLQAVLDLGYDLPYFCWHPALGSVGACRQCAVKQFRNADDTTGMIVMACMTPVADGLRISIVDEEATAFRSAVIGWLMTNHPHDCPVCDEGGECHLQDMTVMVGHSRREHRFAKRTHRNQYLGPFINHEMNRCIACYRCVRFYRDYAGGDDLDVFGSRNRVYFGRVADGVLESPFSGNLVEVCPTGVFTDKTAKACSIRAWDLQTAPSLCPHCGLGCNTLPGERTGVLRRIRNRYHGEVNRYFLCDRGRFGFEFVNSPRRLGQPVIRANGEATVVSAADAVDRVAAIVRAGGAVGIGSTVASLEANFALRRLVGAERFVMGVGAVEAEHLRTVAAILRDHPARMPSLREVEAADAVLILGEDVTNTAPLLDLAIRQAVLNIPKERVRELGVPAWNDAVVRLVVNRQTGPLFIATPAATALDGIATQTVRATPPTIARLGDAIAKIVDNAVASPGDLPFAVARIVGPAARALRRATRPLVVAGTGTGDIAVLRAASNIARALSRHIPDTALALVVPDCNSVGAALFDAPDLSAIEGREDIRAVLVLEPARTSRERRAALDAVLDRADHVVVLDHLQSTVSDRAEVVLPAATFFECNGTLVNNEARAQRFYQVFAPGDEVRASWRWLQRICQQAHGEGSASWSGPDDLTAAMSAELPELGPIVGLVPRPGPGPRSRVPRQSHRVTGRTAVNAHLTIREPKPPTDDEAPMTFSMEGSPGRPPPDLVARYWSPGWNSVQALTRFQQEIGGAVRGGDPGIRLFADRVVDGDGAYYPPCDEPVPRYGEWLLVPLHHLFGSEPRSMESPGVAERAPAPYLGLNDDDADRLRVDPGDMVTVEIDSRAFELPFRLVDGLPSGCAGLPEGLPAIAGLPPGRWARLKGPS
ncbi:MAG: NADH-quinone oxidoreductase subunit NuoG [Thermoanaerobaculales bacterium]|jgi:NADH-quinone oxidoreductase subunit G|nr:NADH-quinone oxidoreductase subunit NuoG [Thermoanaerobaculales bacterium]